MILPSIEEEETYWCDYTLYKSTKCTNQYIICELYLFIFLLKCLIKYT
jgi:hypothetical protein